MTSSEQITRHSALDLLSHWIIAASGLLLAFSGIGFMPLYGRFYLNELPGMQWVSDFQTQMNLHYLSAFVFVAACTLHLLYHWKQGNFSLLPRKGDVTESVVIIKAMLSKKEEPPHDKFLAEQRLAYAVFAITILVLVVTGYILAFKHSAGIFINPNILQAIILLHMVFTFVFMLQVAVHLAAFVLKANRPLFFSMFSGRIKRAYAEQRHPLWFKHSK